MLEQNFQSVYEKFKLQFFRRLFSQVREREGSLSAMEAFSVEVIHELDAPTIGQFADFLGISQSNATYKVNSLIRKGYIVKENSDTDRRIPPEAVGQVLLLQRPHAELHRHGDGAHPRAVHARGTGDVRARAGRHE